MFENGFSLLVCIDGDDKGRPDNILLDEAEEIEPESETPDCVSTQEELEIQ